jgi:hypothetical protein
MSTPQSIGTTQTRVIDRHTTEERFVPENILGGRQRRPPKPPGSPKHTDGLTATPLHDTSTHAGLNDNYRTCTWHPASDSRPPCQACATGHRRSPTPDSANARQQSQPKSSLIGPKGGPPPSRCSSTSQNRLDWPPAQPRRSAARPLHLPSAWPSLASADRASQPRSGPHARAPATRRTSSHSRRPQHLPCSATTPTDEDSTIPHDPPKRRHSARRGRCGVCLLAHRLWQPRAATITSGGSGQGGHGSGISWVSFGGPSRQLARATREGGRG